MSTQKKRNFQIEAFKHIVVVDPKYADETWKVLEHASGLSFEELYKLFNLQPLPTDMMISEEESFAQFLETEVLSMVSDQCDEEDMVDLSRNFPVEFKEYYVQIQAAKKSQAPIPS